MDLIKTLRRSALPYLIILSTGLLAHGMLLINDGKFLEGWLLDYWIQNGEWEEIKDFWITSGYPIYYLVQRLLGDMSVFTSRVVSVTCIVLASVFQYKILVRFTPLNPRQSLYLAVFALVWPFYHLLVWAVFSPGMIFPVMFYGGWYYYLCLKEKKCNPLLYLPPLICIFLSFSYPVFFTYHLAFLLIYALSLWEYSIPSQLGELKTRSIAFIKENWITALLPFVFYYLTNTYYAVTTPTYNKIKLVSFETLFSIFKNMFRLITEPILSVVYSIPTFWFVLVPGLLAAWFLAVKFLKRNPDLEDQKYALGMLAVGSILLLTLSITYGLVWKTVKIMSVKSRYGFPANFGYGLFFLGGIHWLFNKYWAQRKELIQPILAVTLVAMVLVNINLYAMWQARWARTASVIHNLRPITPVPNANIYFLKDRFPLGVDTREYAVDFTLMLVEAWNTHRHIGITLQYQSKGSRVEAAQKIIQVWEKKTGLFHLLADQFDPKGCLAEVVVSPKQYHQEVLIGFRYIYYRLFQPRGLSRFLEDLTQVTLHPLHSDAQGQPCS